MKIAQKYSHLNGEEYLIVHHNELYKEIVKVIESIDARVFLTKETHRKHQVFSDLTNSKFSACGL